MSGRARRGRALVALAALAACDAAGGDEDARLAPAGSEGLVVPPARDEVVLADAPEADDLFPALSGDDLVWLRVQPDESVPGGADPELDCLACIGCGACRWRVMHKRLPDGEERALWTGHYLRGAPSVHEGLASFVDDQGLKLVELGSLAAERIPGVSGYGRVPHVREALVWWYAWHAPASGYAILAWDVTVPGLVTTVRADITERWWSAGGSLANLARPQPFALDGARLVWAWRGSEGDRVLAHDLATGAREVLVRDPARVHLSPVVAGDAIVTLAYDEATGCAAAICDLALVRVRGGEASALAPQAEPTMYLDPVGDGRRVVWVDKREGPYMIVGVDVAGDGAERRLSSEEARVGVVSPPAIDDGRVVWSDRRSGRWRLVMRRW